MNENVHLKKSEKWHKKESQKHLLQKKELILDAWRGSLSGAKR